MGARDRPRHPQRRGPSDGGSRAKSTRERARKRPAQILHTVIHQHRHRPADDTYHLCWSCRSFPARSGSVEVTSWIRTGAYLAEWIPHMDRKPQPPDSAILDVRDPRLASFSSWLRVGQSLVI